MTHLFWNGSVLKTPIANCKPFLGTDFVGEIACERPLRIDNEGKTHWKHRIVGPFSSALRCRLLFRVSGRKKLFLLRGGGGREPNGHPIHLMDQVHYCTV